MKVFANTAYVGRISGPHDALHAPGYFTGAASPVACCLSMLDHCSCAGTISSCLFWWLICGQQQLR